MKTIVAIFLILAVNFAINVRREDGNLEAPQEQKLIHVPLKRSEMTIKEKSQMVNLIKMKQQYIYGDRATTDMINKNFAYDLDDDDDEVSNRKSQTSASSSIGKTKTIDLYNFKNTQYTGQFAMGNNGNVFDVIYDTGSANLWIDSAQCKDDGCVNHKQYNGANSANYKKLGLELDVQFGTGELQGEINSDSVYMGGIEVKDQAFAEIVQEQGDVFSQSKFDGIVGLAFPSMAAYDQNPVFDNIIGQKLLQNNVFSFYYTKHEGTRDSKLTLGGVDHSLYSGDINYHKVVDEYYWLLKADNILVGGEDIGLCPNGCRVIADTGTSLITGPTDDLFTLIEKLKVDENCRGITDLPELTFVLDGRSYNLMAEEYVMSVTDDGAEETYDQLSTSERSIGQMNCAAAVMPLDIPDPQGPAWILGDVFLTKYLSVYDRDQGRVGFAVAKH